LADRDPTVAAQAPTAWTARLQRLGSRLPTRAKVVGGAAQGLMSATAAILAYLPTKPLGLQEGFWGSITAIAVVQSELSATTTSARDQFVGAAIGGMVSSALVTWGGQALAVYALAVVVSMTVCWMFNISSAARLSGSTATIIALVPHHGTVEWMMLSRIAEVGWGITVGVSVVWLVNRFEKLVGYGNQLEAPVKTEDPAKT
jgi:uncharacterized membrane protein YgaE (UPF0421/DUF939 family)